MNQLDMQGRGAIVTGGAAGIGFAIAHRLRHSGARVSLWDRDEAALEAAARELGAHVERVDVTQEDAVAAAFREVARARSSASMRSSAAPASPGRTRPSSSTRSRHGRKSSTST